MLTFIKLFSFILFFNISFNCLCQSQADVMQFYLSNNEQHNHYKIKSIKTQSEPAIIAGGLFKLYKFLISSQDSKSCVFEPTCSQYAIESVNKYGILAGTLNAFDRLTRCNKNTPEKYPEKTKNGKYIDKVP